MFIDNQVLLKKTPRLTLFVFIFCRARTENHT